MKAKYLLPQPVDPAFFKERADKWPPYAKDKRFRMCPTGTEIEHPDCWRLVKVGSCAPLDQECRDKAGLTDEQILVRYQRYVLLEKGQLSGDPTVDRQDDE